MPKKTLVVIVGPTASGKSDFAIKIAQKYNGEIICADSRTVYRHLDIGTAKPDKKDKVLIPHYLLDVSDPDEIFTAAMFKQLAQEAIEEIISRNKVPILVGGTGLYIDSILFDYKFGSPPDPEFRKKLNKLDLQQLQDLCRQQKIELPENEQNKRHLIRTIETHGVINDPKKIRDNTIVVGISTDRDTLRQRISKRFDKMISLGVIDETKKIKERYGLDHEPMKGNIYEVIGEMIKGKINLDEAKELVIKKDMHLAKRQMTWFRRNKHIVWSNEPERLSKEIGQFLNK